jgi:Domain of unknown function (DUF397)
MTALSWIKSSYSGSEANCVEVAVSTDGEHVYVRNTRDRNGGVLDFTAAEWAAFLAGAGDGEFNRDKL